MASCVTVGSVLEELLDPKFCNSCLHRCSSPAQMRCRWKADSSIDLGHRLSAVDASQTFNDALREMLDHQ